MQAYDTSEILKFYQELEPQLETMSDEESAERIDSIHEAFKDWPEDVLQSLVIDLICTAFKQNTHETMRLLHYTQKRLNEALLIAMGRMLEERLRREDDGS